MLGEVVLAHIIAEEIIELGERMDLLQVETVEPTLLQGAPGAFDLCLAGAVAGTGMNEDRANAGADQRELSADVGTAVVDIKLIWNTVSGDGILEDFLEVGGIVIVKEFSADKKTGMVVNQHNGINTADAAILDDVGKIAGIRLPHATESVFLEGFPVTHIGISGTFEVVMLYESLDGADANGSRNKTILYKFMVDLRGIQAGVFVFEPVDFCDGFVGQGARGPFVGTDMGHKGVYTAIPVFGTPSFHCLVAICSGGTVRKHKRFFGNALKVLCSTGVGKEILEYRGNEAKAELGHFHRFCEVFVILGMNHLRPPPFVIHHNAGGQRGLFPCSVETKKRNDSRRRPPAIRGVLVGLEEGKDGFAEKGMEEL